VFTGGLVAKREKNYRIKKSKIETWGGGKEDLQREKKKKQYGGLAEWGAKKKKWTHTIYREVEQKLIEIQGA